MISRYRSRSSGDQYETCLSSQTAERNPCDICLPEGEQASGNRDGRIRTCMSAAHKNGRSSPLKPVQSRRTSPSSVPLLPFKPRPVKISRYRSRASGDQYVPCRSFPAVEQATQTTTILTGGHPSRRTRKCPWMARARICTLHGRHTRSHRPLSFSGPQFRLHCVYLFRHSACHIGVNIIRGR